MTPEAAASAVVEVLARVVAQSTGPGESHIILSEAELDHRLRAALGSTPASDEAVRLVRNRLAHEVVTMDYDRLVQAALISDAKALRGARRPQVHLSSATFLKVLSAAATTPPHDGDEQLPSSVTARQGAATEPDLWLDAAAVVAKSFAIRLVENRDLLEKLGDDEATALGAAAADSVLAAARWSRLVGDRVDTSTVCQLLGITRQALAKRQAAGSLLGLPGRGTTWYPTWQFDIDGRDVRPEVRDIVGAFRDRLDDMDPLLIASWAVTPQDEDLDGLTPQEWIRLGRDRERLRLAAQRAASRLAR